MSHVTILSSNWNPIGELHPPSDSRKKSLEVALHVALGSPGFVVSCGSRGDSPLFWARVEVGKVCILKLLIWKRMPMCKEVRFNETLS